MSLTTRISRQTWGQIGLAILMALVIWLPRGFKLDQFVTTDEVAWLPRSANFYYALVHGDFVATRMNESPGITLMWVETIAHLLDFPQYRGFGQGLLDKYKFYEDILVSNGVTPHDILVTSRILMVLVNTLALAVTFFISLRIFKLLPTIVGFLFIAFDPYHIAITRLAHLDGPMGTFLYLSIVAYLAYLLVRRRNGYLLISAAAGGLAVLAKISAWIGLPVIGMLTLVDYFFWQRRGSQELAGAPAGLFKGLVRPLLIWGGIFLLTIMLIYPAMWVQPVQTFSMLALTPLNFALRVIDAAPAGLSSVAETAEVQFVFGDQPLAYLLRYPADYFNLASPVVLLGLILALVAYAYKQGALGEERIRRALVGLLIFALTYTLVMTIPPKSSPKYFLPVYPAMAMIAGIGWVAGIGWLVERVRLKQWALVTSVLLGSVVLFQVIGALRTFPYYFSYFNPLVGEVKIFGSGEGLDQAAAYLNQKPNPESLKVLSWYGIGPFSYFFKGKTETIPVGVDQWSEEDIAFLHEMDYLITYQNQWMRGIPPGLFEFLAGIDAEYTVVLNGNEYARIYAVDSILRYHDNR